MGNSSKRVVTTEVEPTDAALRRIERAMAVDGSHVSLDDPLGFDHDVRAIRNGQVVGARRIA